MWLPQGPHSAQQPRRGVSNESGGIGRIGRPTIEVLGAEDEMAKRMVRKFPDRKISETFLHFAAPLLHDLPSEAPERRARDALQVSFTAWNALIFAMCSTTTGISPRFATSLPTNPRRPFSWSK